MEARLEHPGIVPVYDLGDRSGERPFYTMKLVQGRTLATAIREFHDQPRARRTRSVEQLHLLKAFLSVTQTMEFAHARGVLHRDLKPQNIILGEYGETVILDWGLAKEHARRMDAAMPDSSAPAPPSTPSTAPPVVTLPGTIQGTPAYMSPEQATGRVREVDQRSDIYALGVMLFEILTGKLPFDADSSESMLMLVVEAEPARPRTYDAGIPPALEAICIKAMQKSPDARYGNVRALREDIERFLADVPVSAHRETIAQRLTRSARRHKSLVIGTAAVLAVAALAAGILGVVQTVQNRKLNALNAQLENSNRLEREARDAVSELADLNRDLAVRAQRQACAGLSASRPAAAARRRSRDRLALPGTQHRAGAGRLAGDPTGQLGESGGLERAAPGGGRSATNTASPRGRAVSRALATDSDARSTAGTCATRIAA